MNDVPHLTESVIIKLPAEIDVINAEETGWLLMSAFTPGGVVVADMSAPQSIGDRLSATPGVARRSGATNLLQADRMLAIYPTVAEAISAAPQASSNREQPEGG